MTYQDEKFQEAANITAQTYGNFIEDGNIKYAGKHVHVDIYSAKNLDNAKLVKEAMLNCIQAVNACMLHIHVHDFGEGFGVTGTAILAESHMSIHTWPEEEFAAVDMFTCGQCNPKLIIPVLEMYFKPGFMLTREYTRGEKYIGDRNNNSVCR